MHLAGALADRLPVLPRKPSSSSRPGVTVICGANAQGKTSLLEAVALGARPGRRSAAFPTPRWCAPGADAGRSCAPRSSTASGVQLLEAEIRAAGRNRVLVQPPARCTRARDLPGLLRVTVFSPDDLAAGEGRARAAGATTSTTSWWRARAALRRGAGRLRAGPAATQRAAARGGIRDDDDAGDARRVRRASSRGGRGARPGPAAAARTAGARRSPTRTPSWPAADTASTRALRGGVVAGAARRPTSSRRRCSARRSRHGRQRRDRPRGHAWSAPIATSGGCAIDGLDSAHAGVTGRAAHARARVAARRPPASCTELTGSAAGAAARRRVQRARRRSGPTRSSRNLAAGPDVVTTAGVVPAGVERRTRAPHRRAGRIVEAVG